MRRRELVASLGAATALWPIAARAQQRVVSIGVLHGVSAAQWKDRMVGFNRGLGEGGFSEGHNLSIEYRWAEGHFERLPTMAADLVSRKVAVICAGASDIAIRAAIEATSTIPIVFTTASDPVRAGFVQSLHRPGGHVTGATFMGLNLSPNGWSCCRSSVRASRVSRFLLIPTTLGSCKTTSAWQRQRRSCSGSILWLSRPETKPRSNAPLQLPQSARLERDPSCVTRIDSQISASMI